VRYNEAHMIASDIEKQPHAEAANSAILTKQQAAEYLQTSPRYIERMVSSGRLNALKPTGRLWRVRRRELDRFLDAAATMGGEP
jgi:excisionase family DNA binding protein